MADPTQDSVQQFRHLIWQIMVEIGKPNLVDYFSILEKIDPQGITRRLKSHFGDTFELFGRLIDERLELRRLRKSRAENDVIDILLNINEENGEINRTHIEHLCLGAQVLVNAWAIGRDPSVWENPTSFMPERFLDLDVDVRVPLMLGSLINSFDWKLDGGMKPEELDMDDKFGIAVQKDQPLRVVPFTA
ncbi:hypothetical protein RHGRI_023462 [Rhododendron griersonianum]|uniref:Cytochrome P450 n=1 Tax=Rhododendron griersonianum TaxID=479676 RepID=A0AAV6J7L8_9ERIC|nr:hypothetical protein RHGRI_023462 [Rhododendron griersonianum]